jgi:hypothetical protein
VSNDKEVSTESHSLINFPFEIHNEKLIVTKEGIIDSFWEIDIVHGWENIFERHARPKFCKSIPNRFQAKEWSLENIREVLKLGEGYILLKKRRWKGFVGHPNDRGKYGIFFLFYFSHFIFESFSFLSFYFLSFYFIFVSNSN